MADKRSYITGKGKPPRDKQFQKGVSGNPGGRPKGAKSTDRLMAEELDVAIAISENGERRVISKRHGVVKQVVNKSLAGDPKFVPFVLDHDRRMQAQNDQGGALPWSTEADEKVLASVRQRLLARDEEPSS